MSQYSIPIKYRRMENLHIVFWLFKDIGWCLFWKPLGLVMIIPTLAISVMIAYRTREMVSELCHNLAITFWISANSYWMISEFMGYDTLHVYGPVTYKHLAIIPFMMGVFCLVYYYVIWQPKNPNAIETM
ncbi:hypothetical protein [Mucilaginibacter phyllosphaerae]|uniref:Uncharacterized protein n=2 Tax=Mucilaginibacter phyllosphaerae TaxID=1812349 RepID=A0ABR6I4M7_9SPHI|nr:hypothetical protein [Mucilaginibacter phyllosphaerae]MBB3967991.1 hypothetical protein [Mucilaginibacter phyllosphaerae]GGH01968.1 hypothetical protein GCM10007352_03960 [Mucilaginibacter phyllosphaerae]